MPKCTKKFNYRDTVTLCCDSCDRHFNSEKLYKLHKKVVHNITWNIVPTTFICENCGYSTVLNGGVKEHQKRCKKTLPH